MKNLIYVFFLMTSLQAMAVGTKDCFAPKSIESECKKVTADIAFQDYKLKQTQVLVETKTGNPVNVDINVSGKKIIFFDEDKAYIVQVADMDQSAEGQILSLSITTRTANGVPDQKFETTKNKTFALAQGKVKSTLVETQFLIQFLSDKTFESKSLKHDPTTVASAVMTSDFSGVKETLSNGTEIISSATSGLNVDLNGSGYTLKSLTMAGTNQPTQVRQFANLLGVKVQDAISDFVNRHVAVLQLRKELNHCKMVGILANCAQLEIDLRNVDSERDHHFISMIKEPDLKVRPAAQVKPDPAPQVEVRRHCPHPPKTQFPSAILYYYYYDANGDCVAVSTSAPLQGSL